MKALSLISALVCGISLYAAENVRYTISGNVDGIDGKTMYVFDYDIRQNIDSTTVADGKFRISGTYGRKAFVRVECGNTFSNCVLDEGPTVVDFETHRPASGSDINMMYTAMCETNNEFFANMNKRRQGIIDSGLTGDSLAAAFKAAADEMLPAYKEFYRNAVLGNLDNGIGESALMTYSNYCTTDEWDSLYASFTDYMLSRNTVQRLDEQFAHRRRTEEGKPFVDFEAKNPDGSTARLSDYVGKGKYVLADFWASWCGPCIAEAKDTLIPLYEKYKDADNFIILGVATWDDEEASKRAIEKHGYRWPQIIDAGMTPMELYGFSGIPMIILFGPDGTILSRDLRGESLTKTVENHIAR